MIGSILIDLLVLAAVAAFGWAGWQLGAAVSTVRFSASITAFAIAALLRDPIGRLVKAATGGSVDFARLVAMLVVGIGIYLAMSSMVGWWFARRKERRLADPDLELVADPLDDPRLAAIPGAALGLCWALLFVALLVLLPSDNFLSRGAIASQTGGLLVRQEAGIRWLARGFPHYTQTLPKGESGAVLVDDDDARREIHPRRFDDLAGDTDAVEQLQTSIDALRADDGVTELTWNLEVADVAERHARTLFEEEYLGARTPGGQRLAERVMASLGDARGEYEQEVGVRVVWAHSPGNALGAIVDDKRSNELVTDPAYTEIGIGVVSGGWFNGDIYVIALIAKLDVLDDDDGEGGDDASSDDGDGGDADASEGDGSIDAGSDLDGDGEPDSLAIDPDADASEQADTDGDGIPDIGDPDPLTPDICDPGSIDPACAGTSP